MAVAPLGDAFVVNAYTAGDQQTAGNQSVAMDAAGNFIVVWQSQGQDGDGWGVYGQRFDPDGQRLGEEFRVNTTTTGDQTDPAVAMNASGQFVVAWNNMQPGAFGIHFREFSGSGEPLREESIAFQDVSDLKRVALSDAGNVLVASERFGGIRTFSQGQPLWQSWAGPPTYTDATGYDDGNVLVVSTMPRIEFNSPSTWIERFTVEGVSLGSTLLLDDRYAPSFSSYVEFHPLGNSLGQVAAIVGSTVSADLRAEAAAKLGGTVIWGISPDDAALGEDGRVLVARNSSVEIYSSVGALEDGAIVSPAPGKHSIAARSGDRVAVSWAADGEVRARVFQITATTSPPIPTAVFPSIDAMAIAEGAVALQALRELVVAFQQPLSAMGGATGVGSALNPSNWMLLKDGENISSVIDEIEYAVEPAYGRYGVRLHLSAPLTRGDYKLIVKRTLTSSAGIPLPEDFSRSFLVSVRPLSLGGKELDVAGNVAGDNVMVGTSDGTLYAWRLTAAAGDWTGPTTLVVDPSIASPRVAVDDQGGFLVAWNEGGALAWQRFDGRSQPVGNVQRPGVPSQAFAVASASSESSAIAFWTGTTTLVQRVDAHGAPWGEPLDFGGSPLVALDASNNGDLVGTYTALVPTKNETVLYFRSCRAGSDRFDEPQQVNAAPTWGVRQDPNTIGRREVGTSQIAFDRDGHLVVAWSEAASFQDIHSGTDSAGQSTSIVFRRMTPAGTVLAQAVVSNVAHLVAWRDDIEPMPPLTVVPTTDTRLIQQGNDWAVFWRQGEGQLMVHDVSAEGASVGDPQTLYRDMDRYLVAHAGEHAYRVVVEHGELLLENRSIDPFPLVPGDVDGDRKVTLADFDLLKAHFGMHGTRNQGDLNADGKVTLMDFGALKASFSHNEERVIGDRTTVEATATVGNSYDAKTRMARLGVRLDRIIHSPEFPSVADIGPGDIGFLKENCGRTGGRPVEDEAVAALGVAFAELNDELHDDAWPLLQGGLR